MIPSRSPPRTGTACLHRREGLTYAAGLEKETDVFRSAPRPGMLSTTVVKVLAPHRSGRARRFKRSEENGGSEAQDGTHSALEPVKEPVDKPLTNGCRGQLRMPFSSTRQNTVAGCPTDVDYETKRKIAQTVSFDVISARAGKREAAGSNPSPPLLLLHPNERRTGPQAGLPGAPPLSLKPTSSSLLLSLRRSNCTVRNAAAAPIQSEKKGQTTTRPDSPSISCRTSENGPVRPPNPKQTTSFKAQLLSGWPTVEGGAVPPPARADLSADSSARHVPYNHPPLPKAQPVPRRTTLTSTSWWKQVTQDRSAGPVTSSDTFKNNTPLVAPSPDTSRCDRDVNIPVPVGDGCLNTRGAPKPEALATHGSELPFKQQNESSLNIREPFRCHSLPGSSPGSRMSRAADQTTSKDLTKNYPSNGLFPAAEASLLSPTSSETVAERRSSLLTAATTPPSHHAVPQTSTQPSVSVSTNPREAANATPASRLPTATSKADAAPPHNNIPAFPNGGTFPQTLRPTKTFHTSPLGFERSHVSIPIHPKPLSALIPTVCAHPKTTCSHVTTASPTSRPTSDGRSGPTTVCSTSPPSPSTSSSLLTPPTTPILSSPGCSDSSSPNEGRTLSSSQERECRQKNRGAEEKKARRVTWEDSVDVQQSQKLKAERSNLPALSPPPRPSGSIKAPSIFSLLRPSNQTSPVCSRTPKISSLLVGGAGKYRSWSSDSAELASRLKETFERTPSGSEVSNLGRQHLATSRHERTLSLESGTAPGRSSGSLALPPAPSAGYTLRYSSPPYTALMSHRTAQKAAQPPIPASALHQAPSQPSCRHLSAHADPISASPERRSVQSPVSSAQSNQPLALPFQTKANVADTRGVSLTDDNNHNRNKYQDHQNGQISLVTNRVQLSPPCVHGSPSAFVTETLVYSVEARAGTASAPKSTPVTPAGHPATPPLCAETRLSARAALAQPSSRAPGSGGNSLPEAQTPEEENSKRASREGVLGKSRYFSMESSHEQIQKRGRFALKRSTSTPNSNLSGSDSDRSSKANTKMDQVVSKLKKTFSTRRSEDDLSLPWKWRRTSQTPSGNGPGDVGGLGLGSTHSPERAPMPDEDKEPPMKEKDAEVADRCPPIRCTLAPPAGNTAAAFGVCSGKPSPSGGDSVDSKASPGTDLVGVNLPHSPTTHRFHLGMFLSCGDPSPGRGPVSSAACPTPPGKSTPSPRSPFSPFSSLSPVSSVPSSDVTDDVFFSPKLCRRRDPGSPCEPTEGLSLAGPRRSRASTGPPGLSLSLENEYLASSCADLKYGIEPGRSYSVSSVLSSRPSGPGRISTGSRVMSVGNLCESAFTYAGHRQELDVEWDGPHWAMESTCRMGKGFQMYCTKDSTKMRSRSLPRSLSKYLSGWKSGVAPPSLGDAPTAHPAHLLKPGGSHFSWDAEGPPTPPPTPPLSPLARRMSKPPSPSSPKFPSSPGSPQQLGGFPGGALPSRGHKPSLGTFDECSDNSSETTTDDEYYLETGEEEEKETEL